MANSYSRTTLVFTTFLVTVAFALSGGLPCAASTFRGIPKTDSLPLVSPVFGSLASQPSIFHTDLRDDFQRTGTLAGSTIDGTHAAGTRMGFVPPFDTRDMGGVSTQGPLPPTLADQSGVWMESSHSSYTAQDGRVSRSSADEFGGSCLPWRVTPDLGDLYLLHMSADVADGETVSLAFFNELTATTAVGGLDGELGLLVLGITRAGTQIDWNVKWEGELPGSLGGSAGHFSPNEDVILELGWMDRRASAGPDRFEAGLNGTRLVAGDMGSARAIGIVGNIDVFGIGFALSGTESSIDTFASAVPEPGARCLVGIILLGLVGFRPRRTMVGRMRYDSNV